MAEITQDKKLTLKEAYRTFFASEIYRQLETEETKRWWQSAEQIFEDGKSHAFGKCLYEVRAKQGNRLSPVHRLQIL